MDGYCKESSRWVSLLVAEAYYPDAKFSPIRQPTSTGPRTSTLSSSPSSPSSSSSTSSSLHKPFMSSVNSINAPFLSNSAVTSQALHQALAQPSLSVYQSPNNALKYSFPSVNNALPGDYNHYDNLFSRRASVPSTSAAKQPKFASSLRYKLATSQPSAAAATSWPTYSPQQVQQMWQQYHQALGLVQPLKPAVRSSFDYHTQPQSHQHRLQPQSQSSSHHHPSSSNGGLIASLFSSTGATSTSPATFTNRWFGSGPSSRSSEARPRSFQGDLHPHHHHHRSVSSADQIVSRSGATYVGEEEPETTSSNSNEGRSVASGLSVAGETSLTGTINSAAQSVPSSSVSSSSDLQPDHNVSGSVSSVTSNLGEQNDEECDGYDANGCYVIRVYYDWFLVPGSCKCWKRTSSGSFDTLKRIFIG